MSMKHRPMIDGSRNGTSHMVAINHLRSKESIHEESEHGSTYSTNCNFCESQFANFVNLLC